MVVQDNKTKGILLMTGSSLFFCLMAALIKYATKLGLDSFSTSFFRFAVGLGIVSTTAMTGRIKLSFNSPLLLFMRGITGGIAIFITFLSIEKLGMGKGGVVIYSNVIFACIFGAIFLKELFRIIDIAAVFIAVAGLYLLLMNKTDTDPAEHIFLYEMIAIGGAAVSGVAIVLIRKLHETDSSYSILFAQCLIGAWLTLIPSSMSSHKIGFGGVLLQIAIGLAATGGQLFMTEGFRYLPVRTGSILFLINPVINYAVGVLLFSEAISPGSAAGAILVIAACGMVALKRDSTVKKEVNTNI